MIKSQNAFKNIIDVIVYRAKHSPDLPIYTFLDDTDHEHNLTYKGLLNNVKKIGYILGQNFKKGERAVLLFSPDCCLDFVVAFFGCLYAGIIAIPSYPPRVGNKNPKVLEIIKNSESTIFISNTKVIEKILKNSDINNVISENESSLLNVDYILSENSNNYISYTPNLSKIAFLQYTSGSTGSPKGVIVSHINIISNLFMIKESFGHDENSSFVSWLPFFHDMGLIGNIIHPLYLGSRVIIITPHSFLQSPLKWLRIITKYKAHTSGGPNFAYQLCIDKFSDDLTDIDLSSWKVAFNGAEPIKAQIIEQFAKLYQKYGFNIEAFVPCYGLAEATLFVSGKYTGESLKFAYLDSREIKNNKLKVLNKTDKHAKCYVSSGKPSAMQELKIMDSHSFEILENQKVGEIIVKGPNIAHGYWNNKLITDRTFFKHPKYNDNRLFLKTGDLGFLLDGELFITGRIKDLIIIRGQNYYPQDIENTATSSCNKIISRAAAFGINIDDNEELTILCELKNFNDKMDFNEIILELRNNVIEGNGISPKNIILLKANSLPLTSSGKIQRFLCKEKLLNGEFQTQIIFKSGDQKHTAVEKTKTLNKTTSALYLFELLNKYSDTTLSSREFDTARSLAQLGVDSLQAVKLLSQLKADYNISLSISEIFAIESIADLIELIVSSSLSCGELIEKPKSHLIEEDKKYNLSMGQQAIFFMAQFNSSINIFQINHLSEINGSINEQIFKKAIFHLIDRHQLLKVKIFWDGEAPYQIFSKKCYDNYNYIDCTKWESNKFEEYIDFIQKKELSISKDGVFNITLIKRRDNCYYLYFIFHHISVDFWSLSIFIAELNQLYSSFLSGIEPSLIKIENNYIDYIKNEEAYLDNVELNQKYRDYWKNKLGGDLPILSVPEDKPRPPTQSFKANKIFFTIDNSNTKSIKKLSQKLNTTPNNILITSYFILLYKLTYQNDILIGTPLSGRSQSSFKDVFGYFVNMSVLRIKIEDEYSFEDIVLMVKENNMKLFDHQAYPFNKVLENLNVRRDPSISPVYQAMFTFQKAPHLHKAGLSKFALDKKGDVLKLDKLSLKSLETKDNFVFVDLDMAIADDEEQLEGYLKYNEDIYFYETVAKYVDYYIRIINQVIKQPNIKIKDITLLSKDELQTMIYEWNLDQVELKEESCLHQLFEECVKKYPSSNAINENGKNYTYEDLDRHSQKLADLIREIES